jgi:hypothetical protein
MIADGTTVVLALCDSTAAHTTPCAPSAAPHAQPVWASASDTVSAGGRIAKPMRRTLFDVNSISGLIFLLMSNPPISMVIPLNLLREPVSVYRRIIA